MGRGDVDLLREAAAVRLAEPDGLKLALALALALCPGVPLSEGVGADV